MKLLMTSIFPLLLVACDPPTAQPLPVVSPPKATAVDVLGSDCAKFSFAGRGRMPTGFLLGMTEVFKAHACEPMDTLGAPDKDALAYYNLVPTQPNLWALMLGLGMRESSGKYCEGYDTSAGPEKPEEAEAGLFQFSYNSRGASPLIAKIKDGPCLTDVFQKGVACTPRAIRGFPGTAAGDFQLKVKSCPAYAVEYGLILVRTLRGHFGPLNRKEAQVAPACVELFKSLQQAQCVR